MDQLDLIKREGARQGVVALTDTAISYLDDSDLSEFIEVLTIKVKDSNSFVHRVALQRAEWILYCRQNGLDHDE